VDWDDDGRLDIIVGDRLGNVSFFKRLSSGDIFLVAEPDVNVEGKPIYVGNNSSPSVVDWNNDGLPDLVVGRLEGIPTGLYLFLNEGVMGAPLFNHTDTVFCSGEPIIEYVTYPDFHDMNSDGLDDLILGTSSGTLQCFLNTGTPDLPIFLEYEDLRADGEIIDFNSYIRPSICDWNEDGITDVLAAGYDGSIQLYLGQPETGIGDIEEVNTVNILLDGLTNPAHGYVQASISLLNGAEVSTTLYSINGRILSEDFHGILNPGSHLLGISADDLPAGACLLIISAGEVRICRSLVLLD